MNLLDKVKNAAEAQELQADWQDSGPRCTQSLCAQYDGKRCRLLGSRPSLLCEPAVTLMTMTLAHEGGRVVTESTKPEAGSDAGVAVDSLWHVNADRSIKLRVYRVIKVAGFFGEDAIQYRYEQTGATHELTRPYFLSVFSPALKADPLHPTGRCSCGGDGGCDWCKANPDPYQVAEKEAQPAEGDKPELSNEQAKMMRHAVGQRWHRNHYVAAKGTKQDALWMLLELAGYAREFRDSITTRTWHITDDGIAALKRHEADSNSRLDVEPVAVEPKQWPRSVAEVAAAEKCSVCKSMWTNSGPCSPWCPGTRHVRGKREPHPDLADQVAVEPKRGCLIVSPAGSPCILQSDHEGFHVFEPTNHAPAPEYQCGCCPRAGAAPEVAVTREKPFPDHWLSDSWKHYELSKKERGITDGSQLTHNDHAFIDLWHAVRELTELAKKSGEKNMTAVFPTNNGIPDINMRCIELQAEVDRLKECIRAADAMRVQMICACDECTNPKNAFDGARAKVTL